jgi:hypothetical protein
MAVLTCNISRTYAFAVLLGCTCMFPLSSDAGSESSLSAVDTPLDDGRSVDLEWVPDWIDADSLVLYRFKQEDATPLRISSLAPGAVSFQDKTVETGVVHTYVLAAFRGDSLVRTIRSGGVVASAQWFNARTLPVLVGVLICCLAMVWVWVVYRRGKEFYVRPIRGLEAVDEAVGRATEMGQPVLFTPGWGGDIQRPTTIAALNVLQSVASKTAEYKCEIFFPTHDPVIMATAEEVVREAYMEAGQIESYNAENIFYTSSSQLGYAAAVDGIMTRYKPAAVFLLGTFEGEALILAETGNSVGAMQVAGTDSTIQLSFFVVACDYTLIGEELFAASGYLTRDSSILSSVKAQDYMKVLVVVVLILGAILTTAGMTGLADWLGSS